MAATFFSDLINTVNTVCDAFILSKAEAVIKAISGVSTSLFIIYVMLWGIAVMRGSIQEPIFDMAMRMVKIGAVLGVALSLGNYQKFVYDFLWHAPDQMAQVIVGSQTEQTNLIDTIYDQGISYGDKAWDEMGLTKGIGENFGYLAISLTTYLATYLLTLYSAFLVILAKIALAVTLAVGPICILLVMFNATQKFFEAWLGLALNYVWMTVLTGAGVSLVYMLVEEYVKAVIDADEIKLRYAFELLLLGAISTLVLKQIPSLSSSLGGGAALSTMGALGAAWSKTTGQFQRKPRYAKNPKTGRREISDYRSNAGVAAGLAAKPVVAGVRKAKNLYKNSQRNSVANG